MTMVERVARAICVDMGELPDTETPHNPHVNHLWQHYIPAARAAIEAMKEPTERMLDAHWEQTGESILMRPRVHLRAQRMFEAMIQAALEEGE